MKNSITNIFKDSIKNIKKHKKNIIIIFIIILLICFIIYLVYYKIVNNFANTSTTTTKNIPTSTFKVNTTKFTPTTTRLDTVDDLFPNFNAIVPNFDECYERENELYNFDKIQYTRNTFGEFPIDVVLYLPDILVKGGDVVSIPIYSKSLFFVNYFSLSLIKLPFFDYSSKKIYISPFKYANNYSYDNKDFDKYGEYEFRTSGNNFNITQDKFTYNIDVSFNETYLIRKRVLTRLEPKDYVSPNILPLQEESIDTKYVNLKYDEINMRPSYYAVNKARHGPQILGYLHLKFVDNLDKMTISSKNYGCNRLRDFDIIAFFNNMININTDQYSSGISIPSVKYNGYSQVSLYTDNNVSMPTNIYRTSLCDSNWNGIWDGNFGKPINNTSYINNTNNGSGSSIKILPINVADNNGSSKLSDLNLFNNYLWDYNHIYNPLNIRNYSPIKIETVDDLFPNYNDNLDITNNMIIYIPDIDVKGGDTVQLSIYSKSNVSVTECSFKFLKIPLFDYNNSVFNSSTLITNTFSKVDGVLTNDPNSAIVKINVKMDKTYLNTQGRQMTPSDASKVLPLNNQTLTGPQLICILNLKIVNNLSSLTNITKLRNFEFPIACMSINYIKDNPKQSWPIDIGTPGGSYKTFVLLPIYIGSISKNGLYSFNISQNMSVSNKNYFNDFNSNFNLNNQKLNPKHIIPQVPWTPIPTTSITKPT